MGSMGTVASGHVVNLPQDVASYACSLPRLPSHLDVIVVRREGGNHTHRDFRVRRGVVHSALQWLLTHNQYRSLGVIIDTTALAQLPHDANVSDLVSVTEDCPLPDIPAITHEVHVVEDDHLPQSFVPIAAPSIHLSCFLAPFLTFVRLPLGRRALFE